MDPDANLKEQLELAQNVCAAFENTEDGAQRIGGVPLEVTHRIIEDAARLAELVVALDA